MGADGRGTGGARQDGTARKINLAPFVEKGKAFYWTLHFGSKKNALPDGNGVAFYYTLQEP